MGGWQDGALGNGTGIVEPLTGGAAGGGRAGLGHPNRPRPRSPSKHKNKASKETYCCGYVGAQGHHKYAKVIDSTWVEVIRLSAQGKPVLTGIIERVPIQERRDLLFSRGGVLGISESTYPHPSGWTFAGAEKGTLETFHSETAHRYLPQPRGTSHPIHLHQVMRDGDADQRTVCASDSSF